MAEIAPVHTSGTDLLLHAIAEQAGEVRELRERAGVLLAAGSLTAFLWLEAADRCGATHGWIAFAIFVGFLVAAVGVLLPRMSIPVAAVRLSLFEGVKAGHPDAPELDRMFRAWARWAYGRYVAMTNRLFTAYRVATACLLAAAGLSLGQLATM